MTPTFAAFLLLLFASISNGGRTNRMENLCSMKCDETKENLFKTGKSYTYLYQGESEIKTSTGSYDTTGILVKSKVTIVALSNCEMKLKMEDVEILDKTNKDDNQFKLTPFNNKAKEMLEKNEVLFSRSKQEVVSVCMNKDEPIWVQNMKKSIIDILANEGKDKPRYQSRQTRHGNCFVKTISPDDSTTIISYNIGQCQSSVTQSLFTDLAEAIVFNVTEVNCKYAFGTQNNIKTIHCTEDYKTTPLRTNGNNINIQVKIKLERTDSKSLDMSYPNTDLIKMEIPMTDDINEKDEKFYESTKQTLKLLCEQHVSKKKSEIPRTFMTLVNLLKKLTPTQVKEIYMEIVKTESCPGQNENMKSLFYDAIGFVNTPSATSVMVDLIKKKQISDIDETVWFTSLSFMQTTPTIEMIKDLESLLTTKETNNQMYLGISAVTHLYCKNNYESCLMDPTVRKILTFYLENLGKNCVVSKNNENLSKIQISLKSLGNLKLFNEDVVELLSQCAKSKSNPTGVRVSALEVMKHMDCKGDRSEAMEILQNNENDSELRINAYLTVMGCPNINTMIKVREILSKEKVNQVGSFIWTHLTNIRESSDDLKENIQRLLNDIELKQEFDLSKLKFSRNIEKTFKNNDFGMTFDSNIIFSEKSFIPKSLSVNTTAIVLDRPTNFIEMSARVEGLDDILFKLLGPEGYLKKNKPNTNDENLELVKILEEINGNLNIKLFGQQISFVELIRGSLSSIRKYNILEELMNIGKEKSMDFKKNLILLDKVANIPTSLGFPLKFKVQGSVSVSLKIKSKLDLSELMKWPISVNIQSHIAPSIMSTFQSEIIFETPFSNYGMSMRMDSGTDTEFKALMSLKKNEEFSLTFDTPMKKQEMISVTGKSFVIYRSSEMEQLKDTLEKQELCTEKLTRLFGVKMCGNIEFSNLKTRKTALLFGPFATNFYIEKDDTQTGYILKGMMKTTPFGMMENGMMYKNRLIKFEFDSPKSNVFNRRFEIELDLNLSENFIKFYLKTPWNKILMKSDLKLLPEKKKLLVTLQMDNKNIVNVELEHLSYITNAIRTEKGRIIFNIWTFQPFETKWLFNGKRNKWIVKFESIGLFKDNTNLRLDVEEVKSTRQLSLSNKYKLKGSYNTYFGKGKISGAASENYYGHRWDVELVHSPRGNPRDEFIIKYRHKTEDKSSKSLLKYFLTSTISYGKFAENLVKFEIENELSKRHIRASVKTSYGQTVNDKIEIKERIDLQLYGGYTWKDDDKHFAEGSLSFKFPSKGLNYEGRYNSEVSNRLFKMAIVLDKDQQSKVNFKINYLQPKLYLKDTECDITLSLPSHNTNLIWSLKEVDVNKYEYTLTGVYNKYVMKINGKQTEISKLKHDSFIQITLPKIRQWPEKMIGELKVDLVNLQDASLKGKIEIPNSKHKYSFDLNFSSILQNFLQLPTSSNPSFLKYSFKISSTAKTIESKSVFTCNPEEVQVYFNFKWDAEKNVNQQVSFDFHTMHKSPNHKQFDSSARISVNYPGNNHSIGFQSEFKYTELNAQIDVTWNKNKKITLLTVYEIDNSWTEKGLKAYITMKTPFAGMELTHLGINAVGQLRYRKVDIAFNWGNNKKILFDIAVHPRSSNDFTLSSKLVTPFKGANLVSLHAKHISTVNSITSQITLELGPKQRYDIKFEGANNSEGKNRDFLSNLYIESGFFHPLKISFLHKDDYVHFKSQFDIVWMKVKYINVKNDFSYTFDEGELITNGILELKTTLNSMTQMKAKWQIETKDNTFNNNIQLLYNFENVIETYIKGFYEKEDKQFKLEFKGFLKIMSEEPYVVDNVLSFSEGLNFINNFSLKRNTIPTYSHLISIKSSEISAKLLILNSDFKTIEFKSTYKMDANTERREVWLKIAEMYVFKKDSKVMYILERNGKKEITSELEFYSDYLKQKTLNMNGKMITSDSNMYVEMETKSKSKMIFMTKFEITPNKKEMKFLLKTSEKELRILNFEINNQAKSIFFLNYNDILKVNSKIDIKGSQFFDIDILFQYKEFVRYFKLKHDQQLMGYNELLETNLFETTIKLKIETEERGGFATHLTLNCNLYFLKSIDVVGRLSKNSHKLDIIYKYPRINGKDEVIILTYSKKGLLFNFDISSQTFFQTKLNLNLNNFKTITYKFESLGIEKVEINLSYDGGVNAITHMSEIKVSYGEKNFNLKNKFEKVKWSFLNIESQIKSNINQVPNYSIGFQYIQKVNDFQLVLNVIFNEITIAASTKFLTKKDFQAEFKLKTSFSVLKEIVLEMKHKQNKALTQMAHGCTISLISNDKNFQLNNKVEWTGINYINLESSILAQSSEKDFIIKPKSIRISHEFYKDILKETFVLDVPEKIQINANLYVPFAFLSNSYFEVISSIPMLPKFKIDLKMDLENEIKFVKLNIDGHTKRLFKGDFLLTRTENKLSLGFNIEDVGTHGIEVEYSKRNNFPESLIVKAKSSLVPNTVLFKMNYDVVTNEASLMMEVLGVRKISINGKKTSNSLFMNVQYGMKFGQINILVTKDKFQLNTEFQVGHVLKLDIKKESKTFELTFFLNNNIVKVSNTPTESKLDINILETAVSVNVKQVSIAPFKYELSGTTNFDQWTTFKGEVYFVRGPENIELTSRFSKKDLDVYSVVLRNLKETFDFKYETMFNVIKVGDLSITYDKTQTKVMLKFQGESFYVKDIRINLKLSNSEIKGDIKSSLEWMKDVTFEGKLKEEKDEIKGSFLINYNKLNKPLDGEISYKSELSSWKINIKTPFSTPFNKFTLSKSNENGKVNFELLNEENIILKTSLELNLQYKVKALVEFNIPKELFEIKFQLKTLVNTQDLPYTFQLTMKSNLFQDININTLINDVDKTYKLMFSHPLKKVSLTLKLTNSAYSIVYDHNDKLTSVELSRKMTQSNKFIYKFKLSSDISASSPVTFETSCTHNFSLPKSLYVNFETLWNENVIFAATIDFLSLESIGFDFKSKLVINPYNKKYESTLDISNANNEKYSIRFSKLSESPDYLITVEFVNKVGEIGLFVQTPYKILKTWDMNVKTVQSVKIWNQKITLNSNSLGQLEMINERTMISRNECYTTSRLSTPFKYGNIDIQLLVRNKVNDKKVDFKLKVDKNTYQIVVKKLENEFELTTNSSNSLLKNATIRIEYNNDQYKISSVYNDFQATVIGKINENTILLKVTTNTDYAKTIFLSGTQYQKDNGQNILNIVLERNDQIVKFYFNSKDTSYDWNLSSKFVPLLPQNLQGKLSYSRNWKRFLLEMTCDTNATLKIVFNEKEILFNTNYQNSEIKAHLRNSRFDLIFLNSQFFSIRFDVTSLQEIHLNATINDVQYTITSRFKNNVEGFIVKTTVMRNSVETLFNAHVTLNRIEREIDSELNILSNQIMKLKLSDKTIQNRKISSEIRLWSFTGVFDVENNFQNQFIDVKVYWNLKFKDNQLGIGSISFSQKWSSPIQFSINLNFPLAIYQIQLIEFDDGTYSFKIFTPYKEINVEITASYVMNSFNSQSKLSVSLKNDIIGKYEIMWDIALIQNPEITLKFIANELNFNFNILIKTTVPDEYSIIAMGQFLDWEQLKFELKLESKTNVKLILQLKTPFTILRKFSMMKVLWIKSKWDHTFTTEMEYKGLINVKYTGGHEISFSKKIVNINGNFETDEMKMISFKIEGSKNNNGIDHLFIMDIKEKRYGYRINGKVNPFFEGKTEIYTPFHNAGVLLLEGRQNKNGIKMQFVKEMEEITAFEYINRNDEKFMKITPPIGKPLFVNYRTKRSLEGTSNKEVQANIKYGDDDILNFNNKIKIDKYDNVVEFKLASPMLSKKSAEVKLSHKMEGDRLFFDHDLKVKDSNVNTYKITGDIYHKDNKDFAYAFDIQNPYSGPMHMSFGHKTNENIHKSHFLIKNNGKIILLHKGKLILEPKNMKGEWMSEIPNKQYRIIASHIGDFDQFNQELTAFYNNEPYIIYKSNIVPKQKSVIEISLPNSKGERIKVMFDKIENAADFTYSKLNNEYRLQLNDKDGKFKALLLVDSKPIVDFNLGYDTQPLFIKVKYEDYYLMLETILKQSSVMIKYDSNLKMFKVATLELTKNKIMLDLTYNGKPLSFNLEYHFVPNNFFLVFESSLKQFSKASMYITPTEIKIYFNEYFQIINYAITKNEFELNTFSNFHSVESFKLKIKDDKVTNEAYCILLLNTFSANLTFNYSPKQYEITVKNNKYLPKIVQLIFNEKREKDVNVLMTTLTIDEIEIAKVVAQIVDSKYAFVLKTFYNVAFVISFDQKINELHINARKGNAYINCVNKHQKMVSDGKTTIVMDISLDTSFYVEKANTLITLTTSKDNILLSSSGRFNKHLFGMKGQYQNSNVFGSVYLNKYVYTVRITQKTPNEWISEFHSPSNKIKLEMSKKDNLYLFTAYFNAAEILKAEVKQNSDFSNSIVHNSQLWYRQLSIWKFNFETNFKTCTLKLSNPAEIEVILRNEWKNDDGRTISLWTRYMFAGNIMERGIGFKFNIGKTYKFIDMYVENNFHIIKLIQGSDSKFNSQLSAILINKITKGQWDITMKRLRNEKMEIKWSSSKVIGGIIFHQTFTNNVRTSLNLEILDQLKLVMKSNVNINFLSGYLSVFGKEIANIEINKNGLKAVINKEGSEKSRITLEWINTVQGEWKKDYVSQKKLILKQKALNIDIDVDYQIKMTQSLYSVMTKAKCMMINGNIKTMDLGASIDFSTPNAISVELKNPLIPFKAELKRHQPTAASLRYDLNLVANVDDKITGFLEISAGNNMGFTTKLYYNPKNEKEFFQVHIGYIDDHQIEIRIFNENQVQNTHFFLFLIKLLNEHNIEITYVLKTNIMSELNSNMRIIGRIMERKIIDFIGKNPDEFSEELVKRLIQFEVIIPEGTMIKSNMENVLRIVAEEIKDYFEELYKMVEKDEFYFKTVIQISYGIMYRIEEYISFMMMYVTRMIQDIDFIILYRYIVSMNCMVRNVSWRFAVFITTPVKQHVMKLVETYFPRLTSIIIDQMEYFTNNVNYALTSVKTRLKRIGRMHKIIVLNELYSLSFQLKKLLKQSLESIKSDSLYFLSQENRIKSLYINVIQTLESFSLEIVNKLYDIGKEVDERIFSITQSKYGASIRDMLGNTVRYIFSQLKDEKNQNWFKNIILNSLENYFMKVNFRISTFTKDIIIPKYVVIDRIIEEKNSLDFLILVTSPIPLNDIKSIPDFTYVSKKVDEIKNVIRFFKGLLKEKILSGQKFIELLRWFTPQIQIASFPSILPDFESYATILRSSVVTFDKRTMQLKSNFCKVILAKDLQFKKWLIELEQNKNGRIYTLNIGSHKVSISIYDRKVALNGKETDLPLTIGSTKIMAIGNVVKVKDEMLGLTITVDPENDMFTVGISGWYHNKVRGLFGNADNEPFNDMIDEKEKVLKSKEFFETYNNGGKVCKVIEAIVPADKTISDCPFLRKMVCKFLYRCPLSPMAACFGKVNSKTFYQMCINNSQELETKIDKHVCSSARAYQSQCLASGVQIPVPYPCQKCDIKGEKSLAITEYKHLKIKEKVADIVFVVDSGTCIKDIISQLEDVVSKIDENLKEKEITSTRFGLVTFGGNGVNEAQSRTLNQKLFGSKLEILTSLKSLKYSTENVKDILGGITLATNYPFIKHASKHIILINCDLCEKSSNKYKLINELLEKKSIQFSMMINYNFQVKEGESKKLIYGVDNKNIYTTFSRRGEVATNVNRPEFDYCFQLAMIRDGVVFNINFLSSKSEATQKRFIETFATQVSLTAKPARRTTCKCIDDGEYNCVPFDVYPIFPAKKAL